jgi:hypothetical protein
MVRAWADRRKGGEEAAEAEFSPGILLASGLIAGGSIAGVVVAGLAGAEYDKYIDLSGVAKWFSDSDYLAMVPFLLLAFALYRVARKPAEETLHKA